MNYEEQARRAQAKNFALVRTDGGEMIRLRAPKFWFEGFTHFHACWYGKPGEVILATLSAAESKTDSPITFLGADSQLTCRLNVSNLFRDSGIEFPYETRPVHGYWASKGSAFCVYVNKEPEGPQWPHRFDYCYPMEGY